MRIGTKILGGFGVVLSLMLILGVVSWIIRGQMTDISEQTLAEEDFAKFLESVEGDHLHWLSALADQVFLDKEFDKETDHRPGVRQEDETGIDNR